MVYLKLSWHDVAESSHAGMHCHTQLTKCAVMCGDGCRDSHEVIHTETRGPHIVTDSTFQFQWHRSVPWRMQWRWAGRDRWPLSVTSPRCENKSYTGDAYNNLLYLRLSLLLSANYCLEQLVPGNSHVRVNGLYILTIPFYNNIRRFTELRTRFLWWYEVMLLSLDSINSIIDIDIGLETERIRSNIFPLHHVSIFLHYPVPKLKAMLMFL